MLRLTCLFFCAFAAGIGTARAAVVYTADFDTAADFTAGGSGVGTWVDFQDRGGGSLGAGLVSGSVTGANDVQLRTDFDLNISDAVLPAGSFVEIRFRETSDGSTFLSAADFGTGSGRLFAGDTAYVSPGAGNIAGTNSNRGDALSVTDDTDNFVIATYDLTGFLDPGESLRSLRFDSIATGAAAGATYGVDYIRVDNGIAAVPEPSSLALLGFVGGVAAWKRRRNRV